VEYSRHFKFLICAPAFDPADLEGQRLQAITEEIERDGYGVMKARKVDDAELVIQTDAAVGCVLLD
jgi:ornithine decarboxylase